MQVGRETVDRIARMSISSRWEMFTQVFASCPLVAPYVGGRQARGSEGHWLAYLETICSMRCL